MNFFIELCVELYSQNNAQQPFSLEALTATKNTDPCIQQIGPVTRTSIGNDDRYLPCLPKLIQTPFSGRDPHGNTNIEVHLQAIRGMSGTAQPMTRRICHGRKCKASSSKFDMELKLVTSALHKLQDACRQNLLSTCSPPALDPATSHTRWHGLLQASALHTEATYTTTPQSVPPHTSKASF